KPIVKANGTVTAGNASGVNDGACGLLLASEEAAKANGLRPRARIIASAAVGVAPRIMGIAPIPATQKVLALAGLQLSQMDVIELNEAFASQSLAVLRGLGLPDDAARVNPNGAPARRKRRPSRHDCALSATAHRRTLRSLHDVYRSRAG